MGGLASSFENFRKGAVPKLVAQVVGPQEFRFLVRSLQRAAISPSEHDGGLIFAFRQEQGEGSRAREKKNTVSLKGTKCEAVL